MPISCPKCGVANPRGAETCGECGFIIDSTPISASSSTSANSKGSQPSPPLQPSMENKDFSAEESEDFDGVGNFGAGNPGMGNKSLPGAEKKGLSRSSILSKKETRRAPVQAQILAGILWIATAAMVALSIFLLKPSKSIILPIPLIPSNIPYRFRVIYALPILAAGIYTLITAYGISNLKRWGVKVYISWVMVQVILEVLAQIYHQQLGVIVSAVVLVELIFIPLLWKAKYRFQY